MDVSKISTVIQGEVDCFHRHTLVIPPIIDFIEVHPGNALPTLTQLAEADFDGLDICSSLRSLALNVGVE